MAQKHLSFERDVRDIRLADLRDLKSRLCEGKEWGFHFCGKRWVARNLEARLWLCEAGSISLPVG